MSTLLAPVAIQQFKDNNGNSLIGGQLFTYQAGTSIPAPSYTDATGTSANTNPVILNSRGEAPLWLTPGQFYKLILQDASGVLIWSADQVPGGFVDGALLPDTASSNKVRADLAANTGSSLVTFLQSGTGAFPRTMQSKQREFVSVKDFGAIGDGVADDTAAFVAACATLGSKGGTVRYFDKHLIDNNLPIPASITLKGPTSQVGTPGTNATYPYGNMAGLILNSLKTITLGGGSGIDGCLIYRKGMVFPAVDASLFAGTAVTIGGDDAFVYNSLIIGFAGALTSSNYQRIRAMNFSFDCSSGILIDSCADIPYFTNCHGWPFSTVGNGGSTITNRRVGAAYKITTLGDWNKFTNCFAYAYAQGFVIQDCNSVTLLNCGTDSTGSYVGQVGFTIAGASNDTRLIGCQAAAQETGYRVVGTGTHTSFTSCDAWVNANNGILIDTPAGDVTIIGGSIRDVPRGITINNPGGKVVIDLVRFYSCSITPISFVVSNGLNSIIGPSCDYGNLPVGQSAVDNPANKVPTTATSANPLLISATNDLFQVSGSIGFSAVNSGWTGRKITLVFAGALTVTSSATLNISGGTFTAAIGSTLSLIHNGSTWFETGRKT